MVLSDNCGIDNHDKDSDTIIVLMIRRMEFMCCFIVCLLAVCTHARPMMLFEQLLRSLVSALNAILVGLCLLIDPIELTILWTDLRAHINRHVAQIADHRWHLTHVILHLIFSCIFCDPETGRERERLSTNEFLSIFVWLIDCLLGNVRSCHWTATVSFVDHSSRLSRNNFAIFRRFPRTSVLFELFRSVRIIKVVKMLEWSESVRKWTKTLTYCMDKRKCHNTFPFRSNFSPLHAYQCWSCPCPLRFDPIALKISNFRFIVQLLIITLTLIRSRSHQWKWHLPPCSSSATSVRIPASLLSSHIANIRRVDSSESSVTWFACIWIASSSVRGFGGASTTGAPFSTAAAGIFVDLLLPWMICTPLHRWEWCGKGVN